MGALRNKAFNFILDKSGAEDQWVELEGATIDDTQGPNPAGLFTGAIPLIFDPTDNVFKRFRGNEEQTLLGSAARTATTNSTTRNNSNHKGVHIIINVSVYPAAASVVPKIQGLDPLSGVFYDLLDGVAIVATGTTVIKLYPGIGQIANAAASDILPREWRVRMEHADGDSITYSVGGNLVI